MDKEFIKIQTWQIMSEALKSIDEVKAEYAYFDALYEFNDLVEYMTCMRAVQLSYMIDTTMFLEDRAIMVEGMLFANKVLTVLDEEKESIFLTPKEKIHQIKDIYEELRNIGKYKKYDDFENDIFKRGIKKYVKRHCKRNDN